MGAPARLLAFGALVACLGSCAEGPDRTLSLVVTNAGGLRLDEVRLAISGDYQADYVYRWRGGASQTMTLAAPLDGADDDVKAVRLVLSGWGVGQRRTSEVGRDLAIVPGVNKYGVTLPPHESRLPGAPCMANDACASGFCADGVCCEDACLGSCRACNLPGKAGTCSPVDGAIDTDTCPSPSSCRKGICARPHGATCANGSSCVSGLCFDSVCCETPCAGTCRSCAVPGRTGTCSVVENASHRTCLVTCGAGGSCLVPNTSGF